MSPQPIDRPGKIVCVGLNYRDHAAEQGVAPPEHPILFAKWQTALIGPGEPIMLPPVTREVDYEAELGVVIGERVRNISEGQALEAVRGYVCVNEVGRARSRSTRSALSGRVSSHEKRFPTRRRSGSAAP